MKVRGFLGLLATLLMSLFLKAPAADEGKEFAVLKLPAKSWVTSLTFSADGARLAADATVSEGLGHSSSLVTVWDVARQEQVFVAEHPNSQAQGIFGFRGVWISPDY